MDNTLSKLGQIRVFSKVLSKVSQIRNRGAKQKVLNALEKNEYFQRFIHDPTERQQFISSAAPYIKYRFYPKGTAIVELKKPVSSFSIIVKGRGLLYRQKDVDEMRKEGANHQKSQVIQIYVRYMAREQLEEKFKKWLSNNEHGTKALRKRMASLSLTDEGIEKDSTIIDEDDFCSIVEQVLKEENPLLPPHLRENDLSFEEKLLLLSALGLQGDHLRNGNLALKGERELKAGDTFGEASLIKPIHANYIVIATEDTHIVSFTRTDYRLLFASDVQNIKEKIEFLQKTFVEIPKQIIMEMAYYLEEKVLFTSEMAYREGEEADAIYMIKNGEIEISATKEHLAIIENERIPPKTKTKFNEKQRIMVGRLPAGSIFGEEEIIKRMKKRKYSAKTLQPLTFLYVIKKKIFHEIFENFFPDIVHILKDWMDLKYKWREQRIQKEKKIADLRSEENEIAAEKTETQKTRKINKDDSAYKARRTVTEKDADSEIHAEDNSLVLMNSTLRFNNASPSNGNLTGTGSNLYFTKFKSSSKSILTLEAQSKIILKTMEAKDAVQTKEGIEMQKTKLFVDNQAKFNKFRRPHLTTQKANSKKALFTAKRQLEISTKPELPTTQILNFDKAKDLQKSEKQMTQEATQPSSSRKVSTNSLSSPRFFIVRSYGLSNASPSSFDSDLFWRRHSSHLFRDYESGPSSMKNLEVRRGTVAGDIKESKFEDEKYEHMKNYMEGVIGQQKKNNNFVIRPATSLQQFERTNKTKYQVPSNGGSLAYLDTRLDEPSLHEPQSAKNASLLLKDNNFGKKVLSPRMAEQVRMSPKVGLTNCKLKVNGKNFDKQIE